jgi:hypothetical protein
MWIDYSKEKPVEEGEYFINIVLKSGHKIKAIMYFCRGEIFSIYNHNKNLPDNPSIEWLKITAPCV